LQNLGFSSFFLRQLDEAELETLPVGRVIALSHDHATVLGAAGPRPATLAGRLRHAGAHLAVGDWVVLEEGARIARILDRATELRRRGPDDRVQVIAANVDTVFIVGSLDADFSIRRFERYLAAVHAGGASPVIVLTKADLVDDPLPAVRAAERAAGAVPVLAVSAARGEGRDNLLAFVGPGRTAAFTGSSGVGKSTLVNWLVGDEVAATGATRADDAKGRHTTTARSIVALPGGGWLLDTPGMRGFGVDGDAALDVVFEDVSALAARCRYGDCTHEAEPGCAVRAALASGALDPARLAAWRRLEREAAHAARLGNAELARAERQKWKQIHMDQRAREAARGRWGKP
jgi:ribosome biogenesis GTPase